MALSGRNVSRIGDIHSCTEVLPSTVNVGNYGSEDLGGGSARSNAPAFVSEASPRQALWLGVIPRKHAELAFVGVPEQSSH